MLGVGQPQHLSDRPGRMMNPPRGRTSPTALRENGSSYGYVET